MLILYVAEGISYCHMYYTSVSTITQLNFAIRLRFMFRINLAQSTLIETELGKRREEQTGEMK